MIVEYTGIQIIWLQAEEDGVVHAPMVRVSHPTERGRRVLEWRPEDAADVGDLLASIKLQDVGDVAARLIDSFTQMGRTL
ncbi:hypothetical protein AB0F88_11030 [Streptosporangium sp. NPDC023963]|uniref:hypothetical protein n=1 Tax=Streptosporangium sp. NPDC023963 TaxID=3155608 RepID=UPI003426ADEC